MKHGIGGQIIIEPGMSETQIDKLFGLLHKALFKYARIRMFEIYMKDENGDWDFSLFDMTFISAEKYGIKIFATLFPETDFEDIGGFKFPRSDKHYWSVQKYIRTVVGHFSSYSSCYGWVLVNEPGGGGLPSQGFLAERYGEYLTKHPKTFVKANGVPGMDFSRENFLLQYTNSYLKELAELVRKGSPNAHIHVNPHAIFSRTLGKYDMPGWRDFLNSFGGSAHASWHFKDFNRSEYTIALSANCEILRSGAGSFPGFMTELQDGNNIFTGEVPMCPTREEVVQWLMTVLFGIDKVFKLTAFMKVLSKMRQISVQGYR